MSATVLALGGSYRRGGNTDALLDRCLEAVTAAGAEVTRFRLADLDLRPCRGCEACSKDGVCVLKDDMHLLYPHLRTADSVVLASPVYFMSLPALPKMVIDRCQPFWALKYVLRLPLAAPEDPPRYGSLLSCGGTDFPHTFEGSRTVVKYLWRVLGVVSAGDILYPGVDAKGDIHRHPEAFTEAEALGRRLATPRDARSDQGGTGP